MIDVPAPTSLVQPIPSPLPAAPSVLNSSPPASEPTSPQPASQSPPTAPISLSVAISPILMAAFDDSPDGVCTRGRAGKVFPRKFTDGTFRYDTTERAFVVTTPTSYRMAMTDPVWRAAMESEFDPLKKNHTWALVPRPKGVNIVGCKWVFKLKQNPDGSTDKYKARLVARGFTQQYGIDY